MDRRENPLSSFLKRTIEKKRKDFVEDYFSNKHFDFEVDELCDKIIVRIAMWLRAECADTH